MISPAKQQQLERRMAELGVREADLEEHFIRGSGPGGQKVNKSSATVLLKHLPTGLQVRCQESRGQADNRYFARRLLTEKLAARILGKSSAEQQLREKIRRQKRKRSKRAKEKILRAKHRRSGILANRQIEH